MQSYWWVGGSVGLWSMGRWVSGTWSVGWWFVGKWSVDLIKPKMSPVFRDS